MIMSKLSVLFKYKKQNKENVTHVSNKTECYQNVENKYKLTPSPVSIEADYDRHLANRSFLVLLPNRGRFSFHLSLNDLGNVAVFEVFSGQRKKDIDSVQAILLKHTVTVTHIFSL